MIAWLLVFHLLGLIFWVGTLLALTRVLAAHSAETNTHARVALSQVEQVLFNRMAHPAALVSLAAGVALIFTNPSYFLHAYWMYAKLSLAVLLIGLDLWLFVRAGDQQAERERLGGGECAVFTATIAVTALAILILGLVKPF